MRNILTSLFCLMLCFALVSCSGKETGVTTALESAIPATTTADETTEAEPAESYDLYIEATEIVEESVSGTSTEISSSKSTESPTHSDATAPSQSVARESTTPIENPEDTYTLGENETDRV